jgi:hypothetical protein
MVFTAWYALNLEVECRLFLVFKQLMTDTSGIHVFYFLVLFPFTLQSTFIVIVNTLFEDSVQGDVMSFYHLEIYKLRGGERLGSKL